MFYGGKNKKGFFKFPMSFDTVIMRRKKSHGLLSTKLAHLGLVMIEDKRYYNPLNNLAPLNVKVIHIPQPYYEEHWSLQSSDLKVLLDLAFIPNKVR
jgi:hypothetical protein